MSDISRHYSNREIQYIHDNYLTESDEHIAWILNRTTRGISSKRNELNLIKNGETRPNSVQEENQSRRYIRNQIDALVNFIEITNSSVWREIANTRRKELIKHLKRI